MFFALRSFWQVINTPPSKRPSNIVDNTIPNDKSLIRSLVSVVHWFLMTAWVVWQATDFCTNVWEERLYNAVVGVIYCFCFFNLKEGRSRYRMAVFYTVTFVENLTFVAAYYWSTHHSPSLPVTWFSLGAMVIVVAGTAVGLCSMVLYYRFYHPAGPINPGAKDILEDKDSGVKGSDFVIKDSTYVEEKETAAATTGEMLVTMKPKTNLKPSRSFKQVIRKPPAPPPPQSSPPRTRANSARLPTPLTSPLGHTIVVSNSSPIPRSPSSPATDDCKTSEKMDSAYGTDNNRTASHSTETSTQGLFVTVGKSPTNSQQHQNVSSGSYDTNLSAGSIKSTSSAAFNNDTYMLVENSSGGSANRSYMSVSGPLVTPLHSNNNTYHIGPDDAVVAEQSEENITVSADDTLPMPPRCSTPIPGVEDVTTTLDFTSIIFREHHSDPITPASSARISNKNCPLTDFMISSWSEAGTLKKTIKGVSKKSKKIAKPKGQRKNFTKEQLSLATNILYSSRRVYLMLRNQGLLNLPHIRTVHRHLQRFKCWPGINYEMFRLLKLFLSSLEPEDRVCGVLADEIKLAEALSWSARLKTLFKAHKV